MGIRSRFYVLAAGASNTADATPPRFQFTIRGLLWATFWAAVACAAIVQSGRYWDALSLPMPVFTSLIATFSLCAAVGAIIGQHGKGILVGGLFVAIWGLWGLLYIATSIWVGLNPF